MCARTFMCTQKALPHLLKSSNPHVLNIAPPLHSTISPRWFAPHVAYTMAKYGMSLCVLGMAQEFREQGVAVNALWPRTTIDTEAIRLIAGQAARQRARSPRIMADAAHWILTQPSRKVTGRFFLDDEVLRSAGRDGFVARTGSPASKRKIWRRTSSFNARRRFEVSYGMPSVAPLSAAQLHEPILPLARPPLLVLQPELTIAEALDRIRRLGDASTINYLYVVDDEQRLVGVVPVAPPADRPARAIGPRPDGR